MAELTQDPLPQLRSTAGTLAGETKVPLCVWLLFALLSILMVVDFFDRQIVVPMFPYIKQAWRLTDVELGALVSVVSVVVAAGVLPVSFIADRLGHACSLFAMALVWSVATLACAYAPTYATLLAARGVVGLGEAAYGSVGAALLGTFFPERMRGTVLGVFLAGSVVGSMLGVGMGGAIARPWGWQAAFVMAGTTGIVLAVLFAAVARSRDCRQVGGGPAPRARLGLVDAMRAVRRARTLVAASLGAGLHLLATAAAYAWLPSYFNRHYGLPPDRAGEWTGAILLVGVVGIPAWSALADLASKRFPRARLLVPAIASVTTTVCLCIGFGAFLPGPLQLAFIVAGAAAMTGTLGAVAAVVIDVVPRAMRATATAVLALSQNLLGVAAGPLLAGWLSDHYGLTFALAVLPLFCLPAAALFGVASRSYLSDIAAARRGDGRTR